MKQRLMVAASLLLAVVLGWLLAEPQPVGTDFSEDAAIALPMVTAPVSTELMNSNLNLLYSRSAWSAALPEGELTEAELAAQRAAEATALPEGLERFRLLGLVRVAGRPPEALLQNLNPRDDEPQVLRAVAGEELLGSGIYLDRIEPQTIFLIQPEADGRQKQLRLFAPVPHDGTDP